MLLFSAVIPAAEISQQYTFILLFYTALVNGCSGMFQYYLSEMLSFYAGFVIINDMVLK
jgi:hypothetical protein